MWLRVCVHQAARISVANHPCMGQQTQCSYTCTPLLSFTSTCWAWADVAGYRFTRTYLHPTALNMS
jgi:hypothetical protein